MWHIDNSKIFYVKESVVRDIIAKIEDRFGNIKAVSRLKHDFLSMKLECCEDGNFGIDVRSYLHKTCDELEKNLLRLHQHPKMAYSM